jgi:hypothetical protein
VSSAMSIRSRNTVSAMGAWGLGPNEMQMGAVDPSRPFETLLPLVNALVQHGNALTDVGFVLNPDGWRCRMVRRLDFDLIEALFTIPANFEFSRESDTVLDRLTWCSIEGPGAHARIR